MDLIADRGRRVSVDELNTSQLLSHARKEANRRKLDDVLIVDVDAHHYENEHFGDILPFMENEVFKQLSQSTRTSTRSRGTFTPQTIGYQDMGGRVTRYPMRGTETTGDKGHLRDVELALHRLLAGVRQQTAGVEFLNCYAPAAICNKVHDVFSCSPILFRLKRCAQRPVQLCHIPSSNTARLAARNSPLAVTMTPVGLTICPSAIGVYLAPFSTWAA